MSRPRGMRGALARVLHAGVVAVTVLFVGAACQAAVELSNQEFRRLPPFRARLIGLQEIPVDWDRGSLQSPMTSRDYRVTVEREDGSRIVISRVSAVLGRNTSWPDAIPLPLLLGPSLTLGRWYAFPDALYAIHEEPAPPTRP